MKKYFQITTVLGLFFLLVFVKNLKGNDDDVKIISNKQIQISPSQAAMPTLATSNPNASNEATPTPQPTKASPVTGKYKDGAYDGTIEDAFYGNLQVQLIVKDGKIADVLPLIYPNDNRTSTLINTQAIPILRDEAVRSQSSQVDIVSGASDSSPAFSRSLASALKKAQN